ncbi:MAG: PEP-CTERM sorting domain-containing protein [Geminicoccaceae bacterium]
MRLAIKSAICALALFAGGQAEAAPIVLDFEGLGDLEPIQEFYNGGIGGFGSGPGPDFDLSFGADALAIVDQDAGGNGNFGGEPSPDTVMFFLNNSAVLDVPNGFDTGFSFFYSAINLPGIIEVFDGLNATGNILATINLGLTPFNGAPDPTGQFSPFVPIGASFPGTALSIDFGGTSNQIGFDNITFGSATPGGLTPVPEPASMLILGIGLAGIAALRRRQRC